MNRIISYMFGSKTLCFIRNSSGLLVLFAGKGDPAWGVGNEASGSPEVFLLGALTAYGCRCSQQKNVASRAAASSQAPEELPLFFCSERGLYAAPMVPRRAT